jgi:hypothetical protein
VEVPCVVMYSIGFSPALAVASISPHAASSMLEKWNRNKKGTKDIDIQAFDAILQLSVGYRLIS